MIQELSSTDSHSDKVDCTSPAEKQTGDKPSELRIATARGPGYLSRCGNRDPLLPFPSLGLLLKRNEPLCLRMLGTTMALAGASHPHLEHSSLSAQHGQHMDGKWLRTK